MTTFRDRWSPRCHCCLLAIEQVVRLRHAEQVPRERVTSSRYSVDFSESEDGLA